MPTSAGDASDEQLTFLDVNPAVSPVLIDECWSRHDSENLLSSLSYGNDEADDQEGRDHIDDVDRIGGGADHR